MINKKFFLAFATILLLLCLVTSCGLQDSQISENSLLDTPTLTYRSSAILEVEGKRFKDLNRNNQLDPYEDWRLSAETRSKDLVSKMSLEQKAGYMLISSTRLENDWSFQRKKVTGPIGSGFNEEDLVMKTNMFTRKSLPTPNIAAAGTTKAVTQFHERHFILRANPPVEILAEWTNNLQELCESDGYGIPATIASNPRNHITMDASAGLSAGKTAFSTWPSELGLAAMQDLALTRTFADMARQEWLSVGIRKGYMYMADLCTEPRWQRTEGTFGEDATLAAQMIREIVLGFQGETLDRSSIALTTKHFPGGGATEGGQDPHFEWGKKEVFPGGMFDNNLIPFRAAIKAGTSAIMPYYSIPIGTEYPEVAYAYNKKVLQDLLRKELGFDGIINSDTGPIDMMPWGVEHLNLIERYKMALEAGINIFSGTADPSKLIETIEKHPELMPMVDDSVDRLLQETFKLGLFENPYVDAENAIKTANKLEFREKAKEALRKSIVLLRNSRLDTPELLPLSSGTKVYFETYRPSTTASPSNTFKSDEKDGDLTFVSSPEEAEVIILWILPKSKSLFASDGSPLFLSLSKNGVDVDYVNQLTSTKPTVLVVNYTNPWVIDEIYDEEHNNIQAVLATFGTTHSALLDVVTGTFAPSGKMPITTPISDEAVQNQKADVPGSLEGANYALFHFDEGIGY